MKFRIRWKLLGSHLLVIVAMGVTIYGYLSPALEKYLTADTTSGLLSEAKLARMTAVRELRDLRRDAPVLAASIASETNARVTIISHQGEVVGDSSVKGIHLKELENHADRPEIQSALKSGQGSSIRYSATLQHSMLYVALPFETATKEQGILRLALPLSALKQTKQSLHVIIGISLLAATLVSLILSYLLSNVTSQTLRAMAVTARQIGKGEYGRRFAVQGQDELGELAGVMNDMACKIESQLTTLSSERNRLKTILHGMGEGVMVTDAEGIITMVNPAFLKLFAIDNEVAGRPVIDITRHPVLYDSFKIVMSTRHERLEEIILQQDQEKHVLTHWVPLMEGEDFKGIVSVFHDITELKRLEKIRRDFVANVSHELRTPVTIIKGYAETLLSGELQTNAERSQRFVEIIHNHAERLTTLITDLLALSELESGELALDFASVPIAGIVKRAWNLLEQEALRKGITIDFNGIESTPHVLADPARIEQVMMNLLDNAIKYSPEKASIRVSAQENGDKLKISVADTGFGIPEKDLPRIFERFYRVEKGRSREQGGTGLGLAIVKHIVQLHGGTVSVESIPGTGSTFSFTLNK